MAISWTSSVEIGLSDAEHAALVTIHNTARSRGITSDIIERLHAWSLVEARIVDSEPVLIVTALGRSWLKTCKRAAAKEAAQ